MSSLAKQLTEAIERLAPGKSTMAYSDAVERGDVRLNSELPGLRGGVNKHDPNYWRAPKDWVLADSDPADAFKD